MIKESEGVLTFNDVFVKHVKHCWNDMTKVGSDDWPEMIVILSRY